MDSKRLIDSLTSHISLYHSSSSSSSNPNSNPRSSILKWFSSLSVHQRQAHLTIVDHKFAQVLLQMQGKLRSNGHGFFIVLSDIPSSDGLGLPSLCYRRSHGLLARVSESDELERLIYRSIRLFNSKEGERVEECSCSVNCLDSVTVCEEFVESVDRFVVAMDGVSSGGFLREEEGELGSEWVELEWLKGKGYYSIKAFVANRLEVALRLSWLNYNNGKKRGVKLKEKVSAADVAANVYWRKKGCMDWWGKLEAATRRNVFRVILGKSSTSLIDNRSVDVGSPIMYLQVIAALVAGQIFCQHSLLSQVSFLSQDGLFGLIVRCGLGYTEDLCLNSQLSQANYLSKNESFLS